MSNSPTKFLNVDVDLHSRYNLDGFISQIESFIVVLNRKENDLSFELAGQSSSLEETAGKLIDLIQSLPSSARALWDQCDLRMFNIGIQGGVEPHEVCFTLSNPAVSQLASIGASVGITIYGLKELRADLD